MTENLQSDVTQLYPTITPLEPEFVKAAYLGRHCTSSSQHTTSMQLTEMQARYVYPEQAKLSTALIKQHRTPSSKRSDVPRSSPRQKTHMTHHINAKARYNVCINCQEYGHTRMPNI